MSKFINDLQEYGADVNGALERFVNDEELYHKCIKMFDEGDEFEKLEEAIRSKEYDKAFEFAHSLKGVSGNLGLDPLYNAICALVEDLRHHEYDNVDALLKKVQEEHARIKSLY